MQHTYERTCADEWRCVTHIELLYIRPNYILYM